jgi:multidrug efflux pump
MGTSAQPAGGKVARRRSASDHPEAGGHLNIQRQPGANIIGVVDEVQKMLPQLRDSRCRRA